MTTTILIILAIWLIPGLLGYLIASATSRQWSVDDKDWVLIIPGLNIIVLGLVTIIAIDEMIAEKKY